MKKLLLTIGLMGSAVVSQAQIGTGWTQDSLSYSIQAPSGRYNYISAYDEHQFWIYPDDPLVVSGCGPRSEMRIGNDYTSGQHQWQGQVEVISPTTETCIFQVFGGTTSAVQIQLWAVSGNLKRFDSQTLWSSIYGTYLTVNAIHDPAANNVTIYVNGSNRGTFTGAGAGTYYFKCGVYDQSCHGTVSSKSSCNIKHIAIFHK